MGLARWHNGAEGEPRQLTGVAVIWPRPSSVDTSASSQYSGEYGAKFSTPAEYPQFRLRMAAVCKTAPFALLPPGPSASQPLFRASLRAAHWNG